MLFSLRSALLFVIMAFSMGMALFPNVASADFIPCGKNNDDHITVHDERAPCTICHIVLGAEGLISWGRDIMTIIAITVIFAMGVLYIISAGDEGMMSTAKGGIKAALIGFVIMLSAWLIVNTTLRILVNSSDTDKPLGGLVQSGGFTFTCEATSTVRTE